MKLIANLQDIDRKTVEQFGISADALMEAAGGQVAKAVQDLDLQSGQNIVILCGPGNNGGDGFVCARHLHQAGFSKITVIYTASSYRNETLRNFEKLMGLPVQMIDAREQPALAKSRIENAAVIVDALFGSGLSRPVEGLEAELIDTVNQGHLEGLPQHVIAVDIPSGVSGASGQILGTAIAAEATVTFATAKPGLYLFPGKAMAGEVTVTDIGIPSVLIDADESAIGLITEDLARDWLPLRDPQGHKYTFGHVLCLAGSRNMPGAAALMTEAALTSGPGLVTLATPHSVFTQTEVIPELLRLPLPETPDGWLSLEALPILKQALTEKKISAIALGPGLGRHPEAVQCLWQLFPELQVLDIPVIIDADGLNALSLIDQPDFLPDVPRPGIRPGSQFILTPHLGESTRLLKAEKDWVEVDLLRAVASVREVWSANVALKSAATVVATTDDRIWISPTGNSGMATGGSGDVLTGILAGLAAQGVAPESAAPLGVYLHGLAGDLAARFLSEYALRASDITGFLGEAFKKLTCEGDACDHDHDH